MEGTLSRALSSAEDRWAGVGPYYAMFPVQFTNHVIEKFVGNRGRVLDPFAGRATSLFSAAARGLTAGGIEINPVGWVYGRAKLFPGQQQAVEARITTIARASRATDLSTISLPRFFNLCYSPRVRRFLLAARALLDWRHSIIDCTTMAFILIYLHGKREASFSNQMRQSKAMAPDYSVSWWLRKRLTPPRLDPEQFLLRRVRWRYKAGRPEVTPACFLLGDSAILMPRLAKHGPFDFMLTSPPYYGVANYYYDQWLRLWMLGEAPQPVCNADPHKGKFHDRTSYRTLLGKVFGEASNMLRRSGHVYVRTDARQFTYETTVETLREAFPKWRLRTTARPFSRPTQTALFGDDDEKPGEKDIILTGPAAS